MNGGPLGVRKTIHLLVALTILAWATQTLLHQWGFGAVVKADGTSEPDAAGAGRAVDADRAATTLELRAEATVAGGDVRLDRICRWSKAATATFSPFADLVVLQMGDSASGAVVSLEDLRRTLDDAGVNLAKIRLSGPTACSVVRTDRLADEAAELERWARSDERDAPGEGAAGSEFAGGETMLTGEEPSLRQLLTADLESRLDLPGDRVELTFDEGDRRLLGLAGPHFRFELSPRGRAGLGDVSWDVVISDADGAASRRVTVGARAQVWHEELVANRALKGGEEIGDADLSGRRVLVDRVPEGAGTGRDEVVGRRVKRDVVAGAVFSADMAEDVALAREGEEVLITVADGERPVSTVARALGGGAMGQRIRVRNEALGEEYEAVLTGPGAATVRAADVVAARNGGVEQERGAGTEGVASVGTD